MLLLDVRLIKRLSKTLLQWMNAATMFMRKWLKVIKPYIIRIYLLDRKVIQELG